VSTVSLKKRRSYIVITITLILIGLFIWVKISNIPVITNEFGATLSNSYSEVESLKEAAEIIAEVKINSNEYFEYSEIPFTLSNAEIKKLHKGDINGQKSINILETGGVIDNVEYTFEGEKVVKEKEKAIVFLEKYEGPIKSEIDKYVIIGVYEGKYKIDNKDPNLLTASSHNRGELAKVKERKDLLIEN
jgi:hypothetical protein